MSSESVIFVIRNASSGTSVERHLIAPANHKWGKQIQLFLRLAVRRDFGVRSVWLAFSPSAFLRKCQALLATFLSPDRISFITIATTLSSTSFDVRPLVHRSGLLIEAQEWWEHIAQHCIQSRACCYYCFSCQKRDNDFQSILFRAAHPSPSAIICNVHR